ncbi:kinase protein [Thalictrum thalictroides]|uniref:Kinase protein n=1 Tax=Thalictrum thalictroides TaxID=46969 RepID=A0A7J6X0E0_THATH|nr:kinase protein [Thalictrum thalictroides]
MLPVIALSTVPPFAMSQKSNCYFSELNSLDLHGELPFEFANLKYLRQLDLTRNYLNGTIPRSWASLPLVFLSLLGNLVTGTIPKEIGNIRTLEYLYA